MCHAVPPTATTRTIPTICRATKPWKRATVTMRRRREWCNGVFGFVNRSVRSFIFAVTPLIVGIVGRQAAAQTRTTPFQVGDRILLRVEGDSALSDTFTVVAGPALRLPDIGEISLADVPRAQLQPYLARELGRYIHDAVVTARALIRISVVGQVAKPG